MIFLLYNPFYYTKFAYVNKPLNKKFINIYDYYHKQKQKENVRNEGKGSSFGKFVIDLGKKSGKIGRKRMLLQYKTVYQGGEGEITEKKSRFIATVRPVKTEEEALAFLEEMKKKYWDARHNCYVYSIGKNREYTRCSDDGEPSGTAGRPMLDVILGEDIYDVAVVVTRYFGGVLLGTGGLVRAYSKAVQEGLGNSTVIEKKYGYSLSVTTDYTGIGKLQYIAGERGLPILDSEYTDKVVLHLMVPFEDREAVEKEIIEGLNGRVKIQKEKELYFASIEGEVKLFES